jgi:hypothetical protein
MKTRDHDVTKSSGPYDDKTLHDRTADFTGLCPNLEIEAVLPSDLKPVVVVPFTRDASSSVEYHSHPLADETSRVKEPQPQASNRKEETWTL